MKCFCLLSSDQTTPKASQPSTSRTQSGTLMGGTSSTSPARGTSSGTMIQPLKNNFNPSTSPSRVNRNQMDSSSPYPMDGNLYSHQKDKKPSLERRDVSLHHRGEDFSHGQAKNSGQSSAQMPEKTQQP